MEESRPQHRAARHAVPKKPHGRRRAEDPISEPSNLVPLTTSIPLVRVRERRAALELERQLVKDAQPKAPASHRAVATAATTGLIVLTAISGGIAQATVADSGRHAAARDSEEPTPVDEPPITAEVVTVDQPEVEVHTEAAPPPPPEPDPMPVSEPEPVVVVPPPPAQPPAVPAPPTGVIIKDGFYYQEPTVPPPPVAVAPASTKGEVILSAAYGQLGVYQDCTMLVTNALQAVGIYFHDWPAGYMNLGTIVPADQAVRGDLIYYMDGGAGVPHIAVYAGNGEAVHGGWNGNQTVVYSAYVGSGPVFIRVA